MIEPQPKTRLRRVIDGVRLTIGFAGLFAGTYWAGLGRSGLPYVLAVDQEPYQASGDVVTTLVMTAVIAASIAIVTGAGMLGRHDVGQAAAGLWAAYWLATFLGLVCAVQFSGPDAVCTYPDCWPSPYQELLVAAPVGGAAIVMLVLASVGRPTRAWIRAAIPVLIVCILSAAQQLAWQSAILPILLGPPPG